MLTQSSESIVILMKDDNSMSWTGCGAEKVGGSEQHSRTDST
jgi:hypothetical protein